MVRYQSSYRPRSVRRLARKTRRNLLITIILFVIFVYALLSWGVPLLVGSLSFLNKHKTPDAKIEITDDSAVAPPVLSIPFESTNSSTFKITGYSSKNSKVEIYFDDELKTSVNTRDDGSFSTDDLPLSIGTNNIYGKTIDDQGKRSLPSKNIKLVYSNEKPNLEVSQPTDGQAIKGGDKKIRINGKTESQNNVSVNGSTVIVSNDGTFTMEIPINDGDNTITIISTNSFGNSTKIERKVNYST